MVRAVVLAGCLAGCVSESGVRASRTRPANEPGSLRRAEARATTEGRQVLVTGREMTADRREILPGGCWDYANTVYERAGFESDRRTTIFKTRKRGPYADASLIRPGDWLYFVNHSYGGVEHSAIFVDWVDAGAKQGLMLSYCGEQRHEPARYLPYDLSSVYTIVRPVSR